MAHLRHPLVVFAASGYALPVRLGRGGDTARASKGAGVLEWGCAWLRAEKVRAVASLMLALWLAPAGAAVALDVELTDVAPDRVERQRAYARGETPLPGTPDPSNLTDRLAAKGLALGRPLLIRIFKETSELEVWMQKDASYVLLDTYPICHWTGSLGPKVREGDRQSPEGFYAFGWRQTRLVGRWRNGFNVGYPNTLDQALKRTGSYILVHGGCSSTGCFAMTDQVQNELSTLVRAAFQAGQPRIQVHVFPFRMTDAAMAAHAASPWADFWRDLKAGYDVFERTRVPPRIAVCQQRYVFAAGDLADTSDVKPWPVLKPQTVIPASTAGAGPYCGVAPVVPEDMRAQQTIASSAAEVEPATQKPGHRAVRRARDASEAGAGWQIPTGRGGEASNWGG